MVRAVNGEVTVRALPVEHELEVRRQRRIPGDDRMSRALMALLTQPRPRDLEHLLVAAAVRIVAIRAVLRHWRVLPQKRPTLLGVAAEARLVRRAREQQLGRR